MNILYFEGIKFFNRKNLRDTKENLRDIGIKFILKVFIYPIVFWGHVLNLYNKSLKFLKNIYARCFRILKLFFTAPTYPFNLRKELYQDREYPSLYLKRNGGLKRVIKARKKFA